MMLHPNKIVLRSVTKILFFGTPYCGLVPLFCTSVVVFVRDLDNLGTCKLYIVYSASSGNVIYIVYILELYVMSMLMQHSHSASSASIGRFRWSEEALLFRAEVDCVGCEPSFTGIFFGFILT